MDQSIKDATQREVLERAWRQRNHAATFALKLHEALGALADAVPKQVNSQDWWPDDLTAAMERAQKLLAKDVPMPYEELRQEVLREWCDATHNRAIIDNLDHTAVPLDTKALFTRVVLYAGMERAVMELRQAMDVIIKSRTLCTCRGCTVTNKVRVQIAGYLQSKVTKIEKEFADYVRAK